MNNAPPPLPAGPPRKILLTGLPLDGAQLAAIPEIEFETGQAILKRTPQNDMVLNLLLRAMNTYTTITRLRVEGHTDSTGNETTNHRLSEARAIAVVDWLTTHGVDRRRLSRSAAPHATRSSRTTRRNTWRATAASSSTSRRSRTSRSRAARHPVPRTRSATFGDSHVTRCRGR
jgi:hypothetical protein